MNFLSSVFNFIIFNLDGARSVHAICVCVIIVYYGEALMHISFTCKTGQNGISLVHVHPN